MSESGELRSTEEEPISEAHRFEFQYDGRGNWTERIGSYRMAGNGEFRRSHVERRTVTYYGE